jgi:hypothetical protein
MNNNIKIIYEIFLINNKRPDSTGDKEHHSHHIGYPSRNPTPSVKGYGSVLLASFIASYTHLSSTSQCVLTEAI